jgi:aminoglycoside phosphotransferase (APT) family kinase protein
MTDLVIREGLAPVRRADQLDWPRIAAHLRHHLPALIDAPFRHVQQFTNGAANLTYLLHFGDRTIVLRRPPAGTLAPGAHDMKREWRVLSRLWRHFDRAPRAHLFCDDHAIAGADFFVMEHRPGVVIRGEIPAPLAGLAGVARRMSFALVDAMAELHLLDPDRAELGDLGKPAGFVARQVSGWRTRWALAEAKSKPEVRGAMARVGARLERAIPAPQRASIVHNDLKLDNCAFDAGDPDRVSAIFDWDMTTLGDPLIDLGTLLNYWPDPADAPDVRRGSHDGMREMGLPARAEITARYVARTGLDPAPIRWYEAFAQWKTAVVVQQLHNRWLDGASADPRHEHIADSVPALAASAGALLEEGGL